MKYFQFFHTLPTKGKCVYPPTPPVVIQIALCDLSIWFCSMEMWRKENVRIIFHYFQPPSQKIFRAKQEFREICPNRTEDSAYLETISARIRFSFIFWGFKHFPTRSNTVEPLPQKPARREIIKYIATPLMSSPRKLGSLITSPQKRVWPLKTGGLMSWSGVK